MKLLASLANSLWVAASLPAWWRLRTALDHPGATQSDWLRAHLARNANCEFARRHHLTSVRSHEDFARRVPLSHYEQHEPWIERIHSGEPRLLTSEPVTHLIPTSGSTGARKLIPFTAGLQRDFNRAIGPWICDLALQHPGMLCGPAYWSITPSGTGRAVQTSGVPIGFADDASYLGGARKWLVQAALVAPRTLGSRADLEEFRYQTLLCLVQQPELRLISIWHPSFLAMLLDALPAHWNRLLAAAGNARELQRADPRQPGSIWPRLRLISCWGEGHAELAQTDLQRRFPRVSIQSKGLLATEACVTLPFGGRHPVAVRSHFFEFIDEHGRIQLVHELRADETYEVVVTTSGGLWRYRLGDCVQVNGRVGKTASLRFLGRRGNVSDLCGEKLSEVFVAGAIQAVLEPENRRLRFAMLAPERTSVGWHYTLYVEGDFESQALDKKLEALLQANPQYAYCRALGQLQPVQVFQIAAQGQETFLTTEAAAGRQLGSIKPCRLSQVTEWSSRFTGTYRH